MEKRLGTSGISGVSNISHISHVAESGELLSSHIDIENIILLSCMICHCLLIEKYLKWPVG